MRMVMYCILMMNYIDVDDHCFVLQSEFYKRIELDVQGKVYFEEIKVSCSTITAIVHVTV